MMADLDTDRQLRKTTIATLSGAEEPSSGDLHQEIGALLPRLTRYARALTHDFIAADDLVQESLSRALAKMHLWQRGTDLRAWLFTILHHQHISQIRRALRESVRTELRENEGSTLEPPQGKRLELRDLERALSRLPEEQRSAILLVGLGEMRYDEAASILNLPIGTVRSRVSRGRETLRIATELFPGRHCPHPRPSKYHRVAARRNLVPFAATSTADPKGDCSNEYQ
jgi:RNA polymerase sigma-70 factor (ECF subfamily)